MPTKQEILAAVQTDITSKTEKNSISPAILGEIIVDAISLISDARETLNIVGTTLLGGNIELTVPEGITIIDEIAYDSRGISKVTLPSSLLEIKVGAFGYCKLTELILPQGLLLLGGFEYNKLAAISIPNSVTTISNQAFAGNLLTSVVIPDSVLVIDTFAFGNNLLTSVTLGANVTTIGSSAFSQNQLTTVTIPDSCTTLENNAFKNNLLTSAVIGNGVTTIEVGTFANNSLTSVTIGSNVTLIKESPFGDGAFTGNNLTSVDVPIGCTVEPNAFDEGVTINFV